MLFKDVYNSYEQLKSQKEFIMLEAERAVDAGNNTMFKLKLQQFKVLHNELKHLENSYVVIQDGKSK